MHAVRGAPGGASAVHRARWALHARHGVGAVYTCVGPAGGSTAGVNIKGAGGGAVGAAAGVYAGAEVGTGLEAAAGRGCDAVGADVDGVVGGRGGMGAGLAGAANASVVLG